MEKRLLTARMLINKLEAAIAGGHISDDSLVLTDSDEFCSFFTVNADSLIIYPKEALAEDLLDRTSRLVRVKDRPNSATMQKIITEQIEVLTEALSRGGNAVWIRNSLEEETCHG